MKKLIAIVVAVTLVAVGSGVAVGQDGGSFPHVTDTAEYPQVKVAQVPIPWQFWGIGVDPQSGLPAVIDRIRISPTWLVPPGEQPAGDGLVFIQRQVAVTPDPILLLEELVWGAPPVPSRLDLVWETVDPMPIVVPEGGPGEELYIPVTETDGAVLVAYTVYKESETDPGVPAAEPEGHFINEAILESRSPQAITQILVNFDIHNGTGRNDITNFELDFLGIDFVYQDVVWALGFVVETGELWGANADNPLVVRTITGGTEVKWVEPGRPLQNCEWLHVGLMFNYSGGFVDNINATVQGYWTIQPRPRRTPGYWKNHPDAWPMETITIGGVPYTKGEAIDEMKTPGKGDKTYTMFRALVAAKLNVLIGNDPCIQPTITLADTWMAAYGPVGSGVKAGGKNSPWRAGEALYEALDAYNNGGPCP